MSIINVPAGVTSSGLLIDSDEDRLNVLADGIALLCTATNGGQIYVSTGGLAQESIVSDNGCLVLLTSAHGYGTLLKGNGSETIDKDGEETGASIQNGGVMYVNRGTCNAATVYDGGLIQAAGTVCNTVVSRGGRVEISSGGKAIECNVSDAGTLLLLSSGIGQSNTILAGGVMAAYEKTTLYSTTVGEPAGTGKALLQISGGYGYNTTIYSGGSVTFENDTALRSQTVLLGGAIQGGDLLLSRNTSDTFANDCRILFENGGTATVSTLTIKTGGLMQVDSKTTVRFQNIVLDGGSFNMSALSTYNPTTGTCRKLLDCTATGADVWTEDKYLSLLNVSNTVFSSAFLYRDGDLYLRGIAHVSSDGTGEEAFSTVEAAMVMSPTGLVIENGTFSAYDPAKEENNVPTFNGVTTTINGGLFTTSVCGGNLYTSSTSMEPEPEEEHGISLTINGGVFNKSVFAGDRVNQEYLSQTRTGDISLTITGGEFNNAVGGAMALTEIQANAKLIGNVNLTITGGTFNNPGNKGWIYGGSIASSKCVGANTIITGNVTLKLDASDNSVTVANLVAGSYGAGRINSNTRLVLTGANNITATGEIWGGCSGDVLLGTKIKKADETDSGNREVSSQVSGKRILSFTGFKGTLTSEAGKIRAFSDVVVEKYTENNTVTYSDATIGGSANLSDVVNWTFENGSKLHGNFTNDFNGDTINLKGFTTTGTFELMTDSNLLDSNDIFNKFDLLTDIQMNGNSVGLTSSSYSYDDEHKLMKWSWSAGSNTETEQSWLGGSLTVDKKDGIMKLTTIA